MAPRVEGLQVDGRGEGEGHALHDLEIAPNAQLASVVHLTSEGENLGAESEFGGNVHLGTVFAIWHADHPQLQAGCDLLKIAPSN